MKRLITSLVLLCGLAACAGSPPVHYYTLQGAEAPPAAPAAPDAIAIGISAVSLPAYLDRLPIVQREGAALQVDNTRRWAEPLAEAVPRVLAGDLAVKLPAHRIVLSPWVRAGQPDWKLAIRFARFEAEAGQVVLQSGWTLTPADDGRPVLERSIRLVRSYEGSGMAAIVAAHSAALDDLSAAIAADVQSLPRR